jgi:GH25 family lysozyme M1 (1,4-beta-N-acetylmuramidase)
MIHFQAATDNWPAAIAGTFPFVTKAVDRADLLREAKQHNPNVFTILRHWYDGHQVPGGPTVEENLQCARDFFATFVDETFRTQYAPHVDAIESFNEYLADSQTLGEKRIWLAWAEAAARVWRDEYRSRPEYAHIRLVLCNTAQGNRISLQFAVIAQHYDCLLGYHPYIYCRDGVRAANDWAASSGLWDTMDAEYRVCGIHVDWIFTEAGPFESACNGWRSPTCLGGDSARYVEVVRQWIRDVKQTDAYRTNRVKGFCLFTTGGGSQWESFETKQPELDALAAMVQQEWQMSEPATNLWEGIDVSRWQGTVDWQKVAEAGVTFAAIRATVGDYYTDPEFSKNVAAAQANGIYVTAYHVVRPSIDPAKQIGHFLEVVAPFRLDLRPVLDVELTDNLDRLAISKNVAECANAIKMAFGLPPVIYTGAWFWNPNVAPGTCADSPLWIAHYTTAAQPLLPTGTWSDWTIWQYTSSGRVPGVTGNVDRNRAKWLPMLPADPEGAMERVVIELVVPAGTEVRVTRTVVDG